MFTDNMGKKINVHTMNVFFSLKHQWAARLSKVLKTTEMETKVCDSSKCEHFSVTWHSVHEAEVNISLLCSAQCEIGSDETEVWQRLYSRGENLNKKQ